MKNRILTIVLGLFFMNNFALASEGNEKVELAATIATIVDFWNDAQEENYQYEFNNEPVYLELAAGYLLTQIIGNNGFDILNTDQFKEAKEIKHQRIIDQIDGLKENFIASLTSKKKIKKLYKHNSKQASYLVSKERKNTLKYAQSELKRLYKSLYGKKL